MNKKVQTALLSAIMFLSVTGFSQTNQQESAPTNNNRKTAKTYLDLMINMVNTNINYGELNSALSDYKKSNNGIHAGVSFQGGITSHFSMVSELYFIRKGGKLKANNPLTDTEYQLRLNSLELPVMARLHLGNFYVNGGPSIAYNLSGKTKTSDHSTKLSFGNTTKGFKRFDAGVQIGGGFELPLKQKRLALDVRYVHGLTNISRSTEMYNRYIMVSIHLSKPWKTNPLAKHRN